MSTYSCRFWIAASACVCTILATGTSSGQWLEDFKKPVAKEWIKSSQGFGAQLLFTGEPEEFLENWNKPTPGVKISQSESAVRGKPHGVFIVFTGCANDEKGLADVVADLMVLKPDGTVYGEEKDLEVWQKKPAPPSKQLGLSAGYMMIVIEAKDQAGDYEVRAKVHDRVKDVVLKLKWKFSVSK